MTHRRGVVGGLLACLLGAACTGPVTGSGTVAAPATTAITTAPSTAAPTTTEPTTTEPTTTVPTTTTTAPTTTTTVDPAVELLARLSVEQRVGQLLMPIVVGTRADESVIAGAPSPGNLVRQLHLGGVIYLGTSIVDAAQLTELSAGLQAAAVETDGIGLLVAVDQEGGRVMRVRDGVTPIPSARSFAGDVVAVGETAERSGTELRAQGINFVLAPVADLTDSTTSVIGDRSYGSDPVVVSWQVRAAIEGYRRAGVASAVKHWPGHGSTEVDSHVSLPTVTRTIEEWRMTDRRPFAAAVDAGVPAVMVGHLAVPALDPTGAPATLSAPMVNGLLRGELGFDGVVMTDALDMGAVGGIGPGDQAIAAITAGVDLLLAPSDVVAARDAILAALADGRLTPAQVDAAALRVLRLKQSLGLLPPPP